MSMRCDRCRFFKPNPPASRPDTMTFYADGVRGGGYCRRKPPVTGGEHGMGIFPLVSNDCWCGEHSPKRGDGVHDSQI